MNWDLKTKKDKLHDVRPQKVTSDWKAYPIKEDSEDKKFMGKGEYEAMLERSRKKKVNTKATVGTY